MLKKNKASMIQRPVVEWGRHLEKLISEVSELKTDAITREEVISELSNKFGPVSTTTEYQECISAKS